MGIQKETREDHAHCRCMDPLCPHNHFGRCKICSLDVNYSRQEDSKKKWYRKKPVRVEAMCFTTNNEPAGPTGGSPVMDGIVNWINQGKGVTERHAWHNSTDIYIETLEGQMQASVGDYIVKGVQGEHYPCKPDIFAKTYELVENE